MRLSPKNKLAAGAIVLVLGVLGFQILEARKSARSALAEERARRTEQNRVAFVKKTLAPYLAGDVRLRQNTDDARALVRFKDSYFAATSGGLVEISEEGEIVKHFTVLDGLPESDLTCLAVYQNKLFIGTRTKNLVTFDGRIFENYVWTDRTAQAVTAFLPAGERLLIGTFDGGLIEFDGENFTEIKAEKNSIKAIDCLYADGALLYAGTFNDGLWIYQSGVWSHFTTADGLPSNRVVGIAVKDKKLYVATDLGLAEKSEGSFRPAAALPALSSLVRHENRLFLTKRSGEVFAFDDSMRELFAAGDRPNARLVSAGEKLFLLSRAGVSAIEGAKIKPLTRAASEMLTDNFVSALAFDRKANLWVGTFRRGIDVFSEEGVKLRHIETENVREINFLQSNGEAVSAASSGGRLDFKTNFTAEDLTRKDGLPSDSVMHFAGDFIATTKGLALPENGKIRVISNVQGLPSASVYATLSRGENVYAGTLGGLAEINGGRVRRVFKDSNSNLKTNWVTALCLAGERLFIGTYGGGIFELLPSGEIRAFDAEAGRFAVNPNAILSDGERLYAGTLGGVRVLDLRTQKWSIVKRVLPAETVLAIAGDEKNVLFGTTNGIALIDKNYFAKGETE